ncbi:flagellar basal body P-ring formation chaperone FlgA [Citrobacter amalonaticus]|nr:flagellar basal body P-ring formation chaperone FlgA [Citrobacter amalonaticus]
MLTWLLTLSAHAALHPVQHSAREQINARVLTAASQQIDALAQKQQWQDYRYTFNVYIPSGVATDAPCPTEPQISAASSPETALSRMNFDVSCPGAAGWKVSVAVRPDVFVPVVMPTTLIARNTVLTAADLQLKKYNVSNSRNGLIMRMEEAVGLTSKRVLQPGKPLTHAELVEPLLVKRDQPVIIIARMEGITASMPGVALKNGRKGEMIKVRNASSQRIISGIVDDAGVVTTANTEQ